MISAANKLFIFGLLSKHPGRNAGGTAVMIKRLANYFNQRGVQVTILTRPLPHDHLLLDGLDAGVVHIPLSSSSKTGLFSQLLKQVITLRPRSILSLDTRANLISSWLGKLRFPRVELWPSLRNAICIDQDPGNARIPARTLGYQKSILKHAKGVIAISAGLKEEFVRLTGAVDPEKVHVIYNPVIVDHFYELAAETVDHPWFTTKDRPLVVSAGRLAAQKDYPTLLRAFKKVRNARLCRLLIIGEGENRPQLEGLIRELDLANDVELTGFQKNPWAFISKADLFVLSSAYEGFGNVLAEAQALGIPLVATDCPYGPAEILEHGRSGKLVPVGDYASMADAILQQLDQPADRDDLKRAAARFSMDKGGEQYLELLFPTQRPETAGNR